MKIKYFVMGLLSLFFGLSSGLHADELSQPRAETFTDIESNKDMLDPYNLGLHTPMDRELKETLNRLLVGGLRQQ